MKMHGISSGLNPGSLPQIVDLVERQLEGVLKMFHSNEL